MIKLVKAETGQAEFRTVEGNTLLFTCNTLAQAGLAITTITFAQRPSLDEVRTWIKDAEEWNRSLTKEVRQSLQALPSPEEALATTEAVLFLYRTSAGSGGCR